MRKTSLADAKAHLSELVDSAEHHHERILILRHGKPAAAIVPVDVAKPQRRRKPASESETLKSIRRFVRELSSLEPDVSAVADLLASRR
jgi:prevent-host-death family protein